MDASEFVRGWRFTIWGQTNRVSMLSLISYDYLLTFDDERRLFWERKWTPATCLFLWNRYVGLLITLFGTYVGLSANVSNPLCSAWLRLEAYGSLTTMWSVEAILQMRIHALYQSRRLALAIGVFFVVQMAAMVIVLANANDTIIVAPDHAGRLARCKAVRTPWFLPLFFVALLCFETLLCALACRKARERLRDARAAGHPIRWWTTSSMMDILIRDSILYYVVILFTYVINLVWWSAALPEALDLMTPLAIAIPCPMGGRLMLNVRAAHNAQRQSGIPAHPSDVSLRMPGSDEDENECVVPNADEGPREDPCHGGMEAGATNGESLAIREEVRVARATLGGT